MAGDGEGEPLGVHAVGGVSNQVEAARLQTLADECLRNIADGHNAAAAQNHAFDFAGVVREAEDAARRDQLCNLVGGDRKAAGAPAEEGKGLQLGFGGPRHCVKLESWASCAFSSAMRSASASASCDSEASNRKSSSGVKKPSGFTTGTTVWSSAVSPRYQPRSSWQKARGRACKRVMLVIFSMPSISRAVRVRRSTKTRAGGAGGKPKCMAAFTTYTEFSPRRTTCFPLCRLGCDNSLSAPVRRSLPLHCLPGPEDS